MRWHFHPRARDYLHDLAALTCEYEDVVDMMREGGTNSTLDFIDDQLDRINKLQPLH
jgi:hypothetical protein